MRIGIEAFRLYRKHKHGLDMVALELILQLQKIDKINQYFIFCFDEQENNLLYESENLKVVYLPKVTQPIAEQVIMPFLTLKYKLDVLHSTGNTAPLIQFCKQIITLHDIIYLEKKNSFKAGSLYQRIGNAYRRLIVPNVVKRANKIITVSTSERDAIVSRYPQLNNKIEIINNACSSHFFKKPESTMLNTMVRYKLFEEPYILFHGNADPKKNVNNVLLALSLIQKKGGLHFKIVITDISEKKIKNKLNKLGIPQLLPYLKLTNYVSNVDLPDFYNKAHLFLYPSLRESFGIPILEAMSCCVPVITSNCSSMPEIAGDAAYLVDPTSPESIAKGIETVYNDINLREKLIRKGTERVKLYNWKQSAELLRQTYEAIFENKIAINHTPIKINIPKIEKNPL
jgi:glycosyltransferase involved in cell wall biosynthesis